jgi:hypothetical protein
VYPQSTGYPGQLAELLHDLAVYINFGTGCAVELLAALCKCNSFKAYTNHQRTDIHACLTLQLLVVTNNMTLLHFRFCCTGSGDPKEEGKYKQVG